MKARLPGSYWKKIVKAVEPLLTEAPFEFTKKGLSLIALDSSKAAQIQVELPSDAFGFYKCEEDTPVTVGVDQVKNVTKRLGATDTIELEVQDNRLNLTAIGEYERNFSMQTLMTGEKPKPPSLEHTAKVVLYPPAFKNAIKDVEVMATTTQITATSDTLSFAGEGDEGEMLSTLGFGDDSQIFEIETNSLARATYALKYLTEIAKAISGDSMTIEFASDNPIHLGFSFASVGSIDYILAPKVNRRD